MPNPCRNCCENVGGFALRLNIYDIWLDEWVWFFWLATFFITLMLLGSVQACAYVISNYVIGLQA